MKTNRFLTSTAVAALLGLGLIFSPPIIGTTDVQAATTIGEPDQLIGRTLVDEQGNNVGEIESVLIDKDDQVKYVIAEIGGFLGLGERQVALRWDRLRLEESGERVIVPFTKDDLNNLPEHRYPDAANRGTAYSLEDDVAVNSYLTADAAIAAAPSTAVDSNKLIGQDIVNASGDTIGEIESVVIDNDGNVKHVIAGVGGFLGLGEKHVALAWNDLTITENGERVSANVTKEQLAALPDHKMPETVKPGTVYSYDDDIKMNPYLSDGGIAQAPQSDTTAAAPESAIEPAAGTSGLRASEIMGTEVKNPDGTSIGEISEVILKTDGSINGLVVDVGGFLGIGEHPVLLSWDDLRFTSEANDLSAITSLNKDQLTSLPEYKTTM